MAKGTESGVAIQVSRGVLFILLNIIFYAVVLFGLVKVCQAGYGFSYEIFGDVTVTEAPGASVTFSILEGESTMSVSKRLEDQGLIVNRYSFFARAKLSENSRAKIRPGEYKINTGMSYSAILNKIMQRDSGGTTNG